MVTPAPVAVVTPAAVVTPVPVAVVTPAAVVTSVPALTTQSVGSTPTIIVKTVPGPKEIITKTIIKEVPAASAATVLPQYATVGNQGNQSNYGPLVIGLVILWLLTGIYHKRKENVI